MFKASAIGARQLVVHEPAEITVSVPSRMSWLVLKTTVLTSDPPGAVITTFLAPLACKCFSAASLVAKKPVASRTISTPSAAQSMFAGSAS